MTLVLPAHPADVPAIATPRIFSILPFLLAASLRWRLWRAGA